MQQLKDRIRREGKVLPGNIIKVDGFLNHRVDTRLMGDIADEFAKYFDVDNITMSPAPDGYTATLVTHVKEVVIRGKEEDLAAINASQIRIVADLSNVTTTGMLSVPARVYLDASSAVGVIGEYTVVVNVER